MVFLMFVIVCKPSATIRKSGGVKARNAHHTLDKLFKELAGAHSQYCISVAQVSMGLFVSAYYVQVECT